MILPIMLILLIIMILLIMMIDDCANHADNSLDLN